MKKLIGWVLFCLGIVIIQLMIFANMYGSPWLSLWGIFELVITIACFIGWFFLSFLPGRREKKELDEKHRAYLKREKDFQKRVIKE